MRLKKQTRKLYTIWFLKKTIRLFLQRKLKTQINIIRIYKLKNNLNRYKFKEKFLSLLSMLIGRLFNKKIEFSIIKITNVRHNPDMFTHWLGLKYKKPRFNIISVLYLALNGIRYETNLDRKPLLKIEKSIDLSLLKNKFKYLHIAYILNINEFFNKKLHELYDVTSLKKKIEKTFELIKYKKIRGLKAMANGRLTLRYRADRAKHKSAIEGGIRNIDSSFKKLKTGIYRGNTLTNTEYSIYESKRRIGTYAVKGWISYF
jgi:hypothetical protein